ncbi:MAG TPA: hypothetical protein VGN59_11630 [Acidimicrobiia bacterium]
MGLKHLVAGVAIACVGLTFAGCSSDSGSTSSSTTAKQAVCSDKDALQQSVKDLGDPSVVSGGKSSVTDALDKVQNNLDSLRKSAKANLQPQIDAVSSSVDRLKTVVKGFDSGSLSSNISKAGNAVSKVVSSSSDLASALADQCPSS